MPGPHYALSEILIVAAAIWSAPVYARNKFWLACLGSVIFGLAAAIGVYRFGMAQISELADFHRGFSQIGGAIAMALMSAQLLLRGTFNQPLSFARRTVTGAMIATVLIAPMMPDWTTLLFIGWLCLAILAAAFTPAESLMRRLLSASIVAIFLINLLFVRRSPILGPDLSWHLFHALVAIWLMGMVYVIKKRSAHET